MSKIFDVNWVAEKNRSGYGHYGPKSTFTQNIKQIRFFQFKKKINFEFFERVFLEKFK